MMFRCVCEGTLPNGALCTCIIDIQILSASFPRIHVDIGESKRRVQEIQISLPYSLSVLMFVVAFFQLHGWVGQFLSQVPRNDVGRNMHF